MNTKIKNYSLKIEKLEKNNNTKQKKKILNCTVHLVIKKSELLFIGPTCFLRSEHR